MSKVIAETIQSQLKGTVGQEVLWSWGQDKLMSVSDDTLSDWDIKHSLGGLIFTVSGHHHKGQVIVSLNGCDTYDVYIGKISKGTFAHTESQEGLYFDEIGQWIDIKVERIEAYAR